MFCPQRGDTRRNQKRWAAELEKNFARIEGSVFVVAALGLLPNDNQVGTAGFTHQCVARKIQL